MRLAILTLVACSARLSAAEALPKYECQPFWPKPIEVEYGRKTLSAPVQVLIRIEAEAPVFIVARGFDRKTDLGNTASIFCDEIEIADDESFLTGRKFIRNTAEPITLTAPHVLVASGIGDFAIATDLADLSPNLTRSVGQSDRTVAARILLPLYRYDSAANCFRKQSAAYSRAFSMEIKGGAIKRLSTIERSDDLNVLKWISAFGSEHPVRALIERPFRPVR